MLVLLTFCTALDYILGKKCTVTIKMNATQRQKNRKEFDSERSHEQSVRTKLIFTPKC